MAKQRLRRWYATAFLILLGVLLLARHGDAFNRHQKRNLKEEQRLRDAAKPKPPKIDPNLLPDLVEVLKELEVYQYLKQFIKMSVTETIHLLKLKKVDFQLMQMDCDITDAQIEAIKKKAAILQEQATVKEVATRPEYAERKGLKYGRLYIPNAVQTFDFMVGSFGTYPPIGPIEVVIADNTHGCNMTNGDVDLTGKMYVVMRGECTFLEKGHVAVAANATALAIINTEDVLESASSGYGIDKSIKLENVLQTEKVAVISLANTTWAPFEAIQALQGSGSFHAHMVPLKCMPGGKCMAIIEEEKALLPEVTSGSVRLRTSAGEMKSFEFLTSNFGGQLPVTRQFSILPADPILACESISALPETGASTDVTALYAHRGGCRFDEKALVAQAAGAQMLVVADPADEALQRLGGLYPSAGAVGITSIMIPGNGGKFVDDALQRGLTVTGEITPSPDSGAADDWINIAYTQWADDDESLKIQLEIAIQKYLQKERLEIVAWLRRKADRMLKGIAPEPIKTDHVEL